MLAVGRSRLAVGGGLTLSKLNTVLLSALARSGPLSVGAASASAKASITPFVKANLPLFASIILRDYATATKKKPGPKKKTTAAKKKTTAAKKKKPAAKRRTVAKKTGTRRPTKKKAVKKKPAPKKKAIKKKKEVKKKPGLVTNIKDSLKPPPRKVSSYTMFFVDHWKANGGKAVDAGKLAGEAWRALSDAEKKVWQDRAATETAKREAVYQKWLAQLNPTQIVAANRARHRLRAYRTEHKTKGTTSVSNIKDPRLVKKPISGWSFFIKDQYSSPELANVDNSQKLQKLSEMYKSLTGAEKKKYSDLGAKDKARYDAEKAEFEKKYGKA